MPDPDLTGVAVLELRSRPEVAGSEVEFSFAPQQPGDDPDHPNRTLWAGRKPVGSLSLVVPAIVAAEGLEGATVVMECWKRTPRPGAGTVECLYRPVSPPRNDLDHPNRALWRDPLQEPKGSLNLVLPMKTAEAVQVGDVVALDVTEVVGGVVTVEIEETD